MARNPKTTKASGGRDRSKPKAVGGRPRRGRPKFCIFCREHANWVDYKDVGLLRRFVSDRGRLKSRATTGTCAQHQRDVAIAVKTAREMALLPYVVRLTQSDRRGERGRGRRGGEDDSGGDTSAASGARPASSESGEKDGADDGSIGAEVDDSAVRSPA